MKEADSCHIFCSCLSDSRNSRRCSLLHRPYHATNYHIDVSQGSNVEAKFAKKTKKLVVEGLWQVDTVSRTALVTQLQRFADHVDERESFCYCHL